MLDQLSRKRLLNLDSQRQPPPPPPKIPRDDRYDALQDIPGDSKLSRAQFEELVKLYSRHISGDSSPSMSTSSRDSRSKRVLSRSPSPQPKVREGETAIDNR